MPKEELHVFEGIDCWSRSVATETRKLCCERCVGSSAAARRRFTSRQMSMPLSSRAVNRPLLPDALRNKGEVAGASSSDHLDGNADVESPPTPGRR